MESKKKDGKSSDDEKEIVMVEVSGIGDDDDDDDKDHRKRRKNRGQRDKSSDLSDLGCDPKNENSPSSSSQMLGLLEEFTKIYADRLQRVEQTAMKTPDKQYLESKVCVLESWVRDLGEQNAILVATVEELEREAADRVALLEDRLSKMAATTRESCVSLRDHQLQVSSLVADKLGLEKEAHGLGDKLANLERSNLRLREENGNLQGDLNNLIQVISRARVTGQWEADDLTFTCVTPEQVFGPVLSSSRRSSQSLKDSHREYIHQMFEDHIKKENSSIRSSLSNLHDGDSSLYGSRGSDKDVLIVKLKADLRCSQTANEEINCQLVERDKQIANLQTQLTDLHHQHAESQSEVSRLGHTLQELRHRTRHESVEVSRKEEVIRHFLSKAGRRDSLKGSFASLCDLDSATIGEGNIEAQLSENIDILASRLAELEDECQQLRNQHSALQDTHSLCAPTINMLQDQLSRSQQAQVESRSVLTAEVAERHDQIVALKDQLKDQEESHHETKMQLQLRNEVIKDLRKEIRELRDSSPNSKSALTSMREEITNCKEVKSEETQTQQADKNDKGLTVDRSSTSPSNGLYSSLDQLTQVSKLQNELAEKKILLRELQSHLASSRQEVNLKDETLHKLEQKLDATRRGDGQKGERMQYLTGQLTSLQLEVGRTHGQAEHLRRQVENKSEILQKMESENSSLTRILNDKSSMLEKYQSDVLKLSSDLDRKKKEVAEQRLTIGTLQDALVASKRTCDELRIRLESDVSESGMSVHHGNLPSQVFAASCNNNCNDLRSIHPSGNADSIPSNGLAAQKHYEPATACSESCPPSLLPPPPPPSSSTTLSNPSEALKCGSATCLVPEGCLSNSDHLSPTTSPSSFSSSPCLRDLQDCSSPCNSNAVNRHSCTIASSSNNLPELRTTSSDLCAKNELNRDALCAKRELNENDLCAKREFNLNVFSAIDNPSALPLSNGDHAPRSEAGFQPGKWVNGDVSRANVPTTEQAIQGSSTSPCKENVTTVFRSGIQGQIYDV